MSDEHHFSTEARGRRRPTRLPGRAVRAALGALFATAALFTHGVTTRAHGQQTPTLSVALAGCPNVARDLDWPPTDRRTVERTDGGHIVLVARTGPLVGRAAVDLDVQSCQALVVTVGEPLSTAAYPVTGQTLGGGTVDAARLRASLLALDPGIVVGTVDASCTGSGVCAGGSSLARLLAQLPTEDVRDLHTMPDWGLWAPLAPSQPRHAGVPAGSVDTFYSSADLSSLGVALAADGLGLIVPASGPVRATPGPEHGPRFYTARVHGPVPGLAVAFYDAAQDVHRWLGVIEGAAALSRPRQIAVPGPDPEQPLWVAEATRITGHARHVVVCTLDPWNGAVFVVGPGDGRLRGSSVALPAIARAIPLAEVVGQAATGAR